MTQASASSASRKRLEKRSARSASGAVGLTPLTSPSCVLGCVGTEGSVAFRLSRCTGGVAPRRGGRYFGLQRKDVTAAPCPAISQRDRGAIAVEVVVDDVGVGDEVALVAVAGQDAVDRAVRVVARILGIRALLSQSAMGSPGRSGPWGDRCGEPTVTPITTGLDRGEYGSGSDSRGCGAPKAPRMPPTRTSQ